MNVKWNSILCYYKPHVNHLFNLLFGILTSTASNPIFRVFNDECFSRIGVYLQLYESECSSILKLDSQVLILYSNF